MRYAMTDALGGGESGSGPEPIPNALWAGEPAHSRHTAVPTREIRAVQPNWAYAEREHLQRMPSQ